MIFNLVDMKFSRLVIKTCAATIERKGEISPPVADLLRRLVNARWPTDPAFAGFWGREPNGIQYAAADRFHHCRLWNAGSPDQVGRRRPRV
jgi:hypothetical protein